MFFFKIVRIKISGLKIELISVTAMVVHMSISVGYLGMIMEDKYMILEGIQHNKLEDVNITN